MKLVKLEKKKILTPYLFIAPALIVIFLIVGIPILNLTWYSFADVNFMGRLQKWVGFENFKYLLTPDFLGTMWRTFIWVIFGLAGIFVVGTIISLCLNKPIPGRGFLRAAVIVPLVIPHVFAGTMWMWVLNSQSGIVNNILISLHIINTPISFFSESMALATIIWIRIWKGTPFLIMALLAALQAIPEEVEEAAKLDGATGIRYFFFIVLPLLKPVMVMSGIILMAWSVTIFDLVYVITGGGPGNATELLSITIYKKAFIEGNMSGASAIAIFAMLLVSAIGYLQMRNNMKRD